jgi:hypothetical protein
VVLEQAVAMVAHPLGLISKAVAVQVGTVVLVVPPEQIAGQFPQLPVLAVAVAVAAAVLVTHMAAAVVAGLDCLVKVLMARRVITWLTQQLVAAVALEERRVVMLVVALQVPAVLTVGVLGKKQMVVETRPMVVSGLFVSSGALAVPVVLHHSHLLTLALNF